MRLGPVVGVAMVAVDAETIRARWRSSSVEQARTADECHPIELTLGETGR